MDAKRMPNIKTWFINLSLFKKIGLIVLAAMLATYLMFSLLLQALAEQYEKELYQSHARSLNHVAATISSTLQAVDTLSFNILSDAIIQERLRTIKNEPQGIKVTLYKKDIYQALYPYTFKDNYIRSINIVLDDGSSICMGSTDDLTHFDGAQLARDTAGANGGVIWKPAIAPSSYAVAARQIRQLKFLGLDKLADLYIILDLDRLVRDSLAVAGYPPEQPGFILLTGGQPIYPERSPYSPWIRPQLEQMKGSGETYLISAIEGKKAFTIFGTIPYPGWDYLYFRDYGPLFYTIRLAKSRGLALSAATFLTALILVWLMLARVLKHLDYLVDKIHRFGQGEPMAHPRRQYGYSARQDEIGQLHRSFDEMTQSVKVLRDENYDKQLLLRDAMIKMLQQQVNPHFLYNTLDTINWMAQKYGAEDISQMVRSLGNLFRASIAGQADRIPLADELAVLDNYIAIQKVRFRDRLDFRLDLPADIAGIYVPKLCIQPLVENALKHALAFTDEVCTIRVALKDRSDHYAIKVSNTGSRFEEDLLQKIKLRQEAPQGSGIGLANIDSRMRLLYGEQYGLSFYNDGQAAVVALLIPKQKEAI